MNIKQENMTKSNHVWSCWTWGKDLSWMNGQGVASRRKSPWNHVQKRYWGIARALLLVSCPAWFKRKFINGWIEDEKWSHAYPFLTCGRGIAGGGATSCWGCGTRPLLPLAGAGGRGSAGWRLRKGLGTPPGFPQAPTLNALFMLTPTYWGGLNTGG